MEISRAASTISQMNETQPQMSEKAVKWMMAADADFTAMPWLRTPRVA
jgi:hypothetical protein